MLSVPPPIRCFRCRRFDHTETKCIGPISEGDFTDVLLHHVRGIIVYEILILWLVRGKALSTIHRNQDSALTEQWTLPQSRISVPMYKVLQANLRRG